MSTKTDWIYFSTMVEGYVDKYGMRGIRERNKRIIKQLAKADSPEKELRIRQKLVENNLPLAKAMAERRGYTKRWDKEKCEQAYADCCFGLTTFCIKKLPKDNKAFLKPNYFQTAIYFHMFNELNRKPTGQDIYNYAERITFDENSFPADIKQRVDLRQLQRLLSAVPDREKEILQLYFLTEGDENVSSLEDIGECYGLTRERTRQLKEKALKRIRQYASFVNSTWSDFISEEPFVLEEPLPVVPAIKKEHMGWLGKFI